MKHIHKRQLFMGAGDESLSDAYGLVTSLISAIGELSSLQQGYADGTHEAEEMIDRIELTAENIYTALTGKRVNR